MGEPIVDHIPIKYKDSDGAWRVKIVTHRIGFTDEQKEIFLAELAEHGLTSLAAAKANTSSQMVAKERKIDEDFNFAVLEALSTYKERVIAHHQDLVFNGTTKVSYDRNGNVVSEEKIYPVRLIELELKKVDESYRDKREVDVKVSGGVLVAPPEVESIDDWEKKFSGLTIEGEAKEVTPEPSDESAQEE